MAPTAIAEQQVEAGLGRLIVKHTFLTLVDVEDEQPSRVPRARTDPVLCPGCAGSSIIAYEPSTPSTAASVSSQEVEEHQSCESGALISSEASSGRVQRRAATAVALQPRAEREDRRTTLMMRNLPNNYTRDMLVRLLDDEGFAGCYDFVYLPVDFARGCGLGYAFVNLVDPSLVARFKRCFGSYSKWGMRTNKVCQVTWSDRDQGLKANVKRYRHSPVMHPNVADEFKPCLFSQGVRVPFPGPGRSVRKPTIKS
mmetsp:Transcript_67349/g.206263  ORF Transcript_67349/g.206263 Transcript_67349/m.206263 type:complete len:255 (-) Transcript_67349:318-1082(-)